MKVRYIIPNMITSMNMLCGTMAVIAVFRWDLQVAAFFVFSGAFFDFCDGAVARLLKVSGNFGKELDSLCDVVTFGVAPGVIVFKMMSENCAIPNWVSFFALLIPIFSAIRLAKFNLDERQKSEFIGLSTPANALFFCGLTFIQNDILCLFLAFPCILPALTLIFSLLLVSNIPTFSLKFKNFTWNDNMIRYIFLLSSLLIIVFMKTSALPIIILFYIILSIVNNFLKK